MNEKCQSARSSESVTAIRKATVGTSRILCSSDELPWDGFSLTKQLFYPETCLGETVDRHDRHIIALLCSPVSKGEREGIDGQYIPYTKTSGTITILPTGPPPRSHLVTISQQLFCSFEDKFLTDVVEEMERTLPSSPRYRQLERDHETSTILTLLLGELESGAPSGRLYAESLAIALANRFILLATDVLPTTRAKASEFPSRKLARIKELIDTHLRSDLSLAVLAEESGYSREHFLRIFRASTGLTPHKYVLKQRLHCAKRLLREHKLNLTDIASYCGFSSQPHMTLLFRKHFGTTPAEFRRQT